MESLQQNASVQLKHRLRKCFVDLLCSIDHEKVTAGVFTTDTTRVRTTYFDFNRFFELVLHENKLAYISAYNQVICDDVENTELHDPDTANEILDGLIFRCGFHATHRHMFMSFLYFVVNKTPYLARRVFRYRQFLQKILFHKAFGFEDFDTVLRWDREIQADIFRDEQGSFILKLCNRVVISKKDTDKIKRVVLAYGADLLQWIPSGGFYRQSCVNAFIFYMNTFRRQWQGNALEAGVEYTLDFLLTVCPQALRISTCDDTGKRVDGFTQVLYMTSNSDTLKDSRIVEKVFKHLTLTDLCQVSYTPDDKTFLQLVVSSRNMLVATYLEETLDLKIDFPPLL